MTDSDSNTDSLLTPTQVANALRVAPVTVRQWAQKGLLAAEVTAGGHRRFERDVVVEFARSRGMKLGGELLKSSANRVLVVDDDRQFNQFLCDLLRTEQPQLDIETAFDGFDAGRKIAKHEPSIVLLDIMMPGLDGVEVCRRIKADPETSGLRVIAMTGQHSDALETRVLAVGAECLLQKPFGIDDLFVACGWREEASAGSSPKITSER